MRDLLENIKYLLIIAITGIFYILYKVLYILALFLGVLTIVKLVDIVLFKEIVVNNFNDLIYYLGEPIITFSALATCIVLINVCNSFASLLVIEEKEFNSDDYDVKDYFEE